MRHGSLFSGIGGFDLAAEWMGWENVFHCEIKEKTRNKLKYYWPKAISYGDITKTDFTIHRGGIDIITGGDPCQPSSKAGLGKGKEDFRYLWPPMFRSIREIHPSWIVNENVDGTIANGILDIKIDDLESEGYTCQAYIIPAEAVGALHQRDRVWLIAHDPNCKRTDRASGDISKKEGESRIQKWHNLQYPQEPVDLRIPDSNSDCQRYEELYFAEKPDICPERNARYFGFGPYVYGNIRRDVIKSSIIRSLDGLPKGLDYTRRNERLQEIGNAIVPQLALEFFRGIEKICSY